MEKKGLRVNAGKTKVMICGTVNVLKLRTLKNNYFSCCS